MDMTLLVITHSAYTEWHVPPDRYSQRWWTILANKGDRLCVQVVANAWHIYGGGVEVSLIIGLIQSLIIFFADHPIFILFHTFWLILSCFTLTSELLPAESYHRYQDGVFNCCRKTAMLSLSFWNWPPLCLFHFSLISFWISNWWSFLFWGTPLG